MSAAIVTVTLNPAIDQTVTLDALTPGHVHRARAVRSDAGGKGVNVASCLADWGSKVSATGILGSDNATPFEALFARKGIDDRFAWIPGETRTNLKLLDAASNDTTDINLPGLAATSGALDTIRAVLRQVATEGSLVVLAGSLPGGLGVETYAALTQLLTARGVRVVLDVSGPALTAALASDHLPEVIKPNRQELADWAGRPLDTLPEVVATARGLVARGIPLVVVSLGGEGALFVTRDEALLAHPPPTEVSSTVGAGDALVAGLVAGLHAGLPLAETARLSLAFAAGKLTLPGANLPSRGTILAIVETVRVETIKVPPRASS
ncbi:1-phosphofructokinase [Methylobacterium sp. Leaf85]|uniref:1-phosphofructokinase n=1 Tax=Methylobacterium sp. Leaf85 TaxID=1736241 RepID=UPI0006F4207D|nr:1-phosphofructokinase [Methylobacterium sp. Leaf85]KQO51695.1 1-phosphofructokinase [Methylobacterium sp. Leaf85]